MRATTDNRRAFSGKKETTVLTLLNLFIRFVLSMLIGGFVVMTLTSPDRAQEVATQINAQIDFNQLLLILGGAVALLFFFDSFLGAFWDSEEGWKLKKIQTLLTSQAPRTRKVRGLISQDEWGTKLTELDARLGRKHKPAFVVVPPDEKGYSYVNLSVPEANYTAKRRINSRSARNAERLISETKIRMFHEFITAMNGQQTVSAQLPKQEVSA